MNMLQAQDWVWLLPEGILVAAAVGLALANLLLPARSSRSAIGWLALAAIVGSAVAVAALGQTEEPVRLLGDSYRVDAFATVFKWLLLAGAGLAVLMSLGSVRRDDIPHVDEYYYLYLPAAAGAMVMVSSADLITLFVGLELLSISTYVLVGMRKHRIVSNEAAFKYLVAGGIASAMILYGMSFLYGMSGSTNLGQIRNALIDRYDRFDALIYVAFFLLLAGFGVKIAAAPFHAWAPDVYRGAPTPVTAFLAVVSKTAGLAMLFRIAYNVFGVHPQVGGDALLALAAVAAAAMIAGNAMALRERNVKRLIAYSGIANAGYLLVPLAIHYSFVHYSNFTELAFYATAYAAMNIGVLAVFTAASNNGEDENLSAFAGLYYRAPWLAAAMVVLVLSLAGLPVTGGFFGKLFILFGAVQTGMYWLGAIMIGTSAVSFYYYFGIVRQMFLRTSGGPDVTLPLPLAAVIWICVAVTLALGFFPHVWIGFMQNLFNWSADFYV